MPRRDLIYRSVPWAGVLTVAFAAVACAQPRPDQTDDKTVRARAAFTTCIDLYNQVFRLYEQGLFTAAVEPAEKAVRQSSSAFGPGHWCTREATERLEVARTISRLDVMGRLRAVSMFSQWEEARKKTEKGQFAEAIACAAEASDILNELGLADTWLGASIATQSGICFEHTADYERCVAVYARALAIFEKCFGKENFGYLQTRVRLARAQGNTASGFVASHEMLLSTHDLLVGADAILQDRLITTFSVCCEELGSYCRIVEEYDEAQQWLTRAEYPNTEPRWQAQSRFLACERAFVRSLAGESTEAADEMLKQLKRLEEEGVATPVEIAIQWKHVAIVLAQVTRLPEAREALAKAHDLFSNADKPGDYWQISLDDAKGHVALSAGDAEAAETLLASVISRNEKVLGHAHPVTLPSARALRTAKSRLGKSTVEIDKSIAEMEAVIRTARQAARPPKQR